jgi:tetratricopeptide (TPR) repeat protein
MRPWVFFAACAPLLFLTGCANRGLVRYDKLVKRAASQDYLDAISYLRADKASLYGGQSDLLYNMDVGLLFQYAGRHDSSIVYFARAADIQDVLYTRSLTNEAASLLVNDNTRPYRARPYEMVWLRVFQAFNYLALANPDGARVEMRQAQILVDEISRKAGKGEYRDDALYRGTAALIYDLLGDRDDAAISAYFAVKAHRDDKTRVPAGLADLACKLLSAADRDDDIRLLELECRLAPLQKRGVGTGDVEQGEVVVIGLLGRSPAIGETSFQGTWIRDGLLVYHYKDANGKTVTDALPAPGLPPSEAEKAGKGGRTRSGTTLSIKWAMPSLKDVPVQSQVLKVAPGASSVSALQVATDSGVSTATRADGVVTGEAWGDTRTLLEGDLEANRTAILIRTVTRVLVRTLASEKAKSELRTDNPLINLLTNLGTDFLSGQLEQADVRSWFLLPRTVQIARVNVPVGRQSIQIGAETEAGRSVLVETREVDVQAGRRTFVFFNSLR